MTRKKLVSIIGLGYVGLPLCFYISNYFKTIGFDTDKNKIKQLVLGKDITNNFSIDDLKKKKIYFTDKSNYMKGSDIFIICVPTPINKKNKPDLRNLISACKIVGKNIKKKSTVIIESTVYPGCTENICIPILESFSGMKCNLDFFCGFSPERINPGDKLKTLTKIEKVVSGSNVYSKNLIYKFYKKFIKAKIHKASSIKVAEAAKIIENTQRDINIALINEFFKICDALNVDIYDVIKMANTKWNFMPFYPGLVGGHCISVDPYYLTYSAKKLKINAKMVLSGRYTNDNFHKYICKKIDQSLKIRNIKNKNLNILLVGFSFKENTNDVRNTGVFKIYKYYKLKGNKVDIFDPIADKSHAKNIYNINLIQKLPDKLYNLVIICVKHDKFKQKSIKKKLYSISKSAVVYDFKKLLN